MCTAKGWLECGIMSGMGHHYWAKREKLFSCKGLHVILAVHSQLLDDDCAGVLAQSNHVTGTVLQLC